MNRSNSYHGHDNDFDISVQSNHFKTSEHDSTESSITLDLAIKCPTVLSVVNLFYVCLKIIVKMSKSIFISSVGIKWLF